MDATRSDEIVALHRRAVAAARAAVPAPQPPYHALLRVATGGRVRDVLLGRRSVTVGEFAMVDWERSPLAEVFFSHREGDEYQIDVDRRTLVGVVQMRHLVTFDEGDPVAIECEQETLRRGSTGWTCTPTPELRLQPRRRRKTTVALHRVAALTKAATAAGQRFRALVVVPNEPLRRLSALTLARLGCEGLEIATFEQWALAQARRVFTDLPPRLSKAAAPVISRFKRHPGLRAVLPEIVAGTPAMKLVERGDHERFGSREALLHLFGDRDLMQRVVADAGGALPAGAAATVVAHTRLQFTPTTEQRYAHVSADRLQTLDGLAIDDGTPMQDANTIDVEDCAVLFELQHLGMPGLAGLAGRRDRYDHVVVDETQELAALELAMLGRAVASGGALTVAGDEAQQIDDGVRFDGWAGVMRELARPQYERVELASSYRCPPEVEVLARNVVGRSQGASASTRDDAAPVRWSACAGQCHVVVRLVDALMELRERDRRARIAIVCRHHESAQRMHAQLERGFSSRLALDGDLDFLPGVLVTAVEEVRGLEFDYVIVPDASPGSYPDDAAARRALYVATTRTMHQLWLLTPSLWSPLLRALAPAPTA
ncbi:MAG: ATP-binding domain-containing protein [Deltaproteobacteria bacterium]|nr:ATP-binding domain-containing protein [Deltaproteobacteria bacterium]